MGSDFSNPRTLRKNQYKSDNNLNARIALHERFSTNKGSWTRWVFEQLGLKEGQVLLELGAGPGNLWAENIKLLPPGARLFLSDISLGMMQSSRGKLAGLDHFQFGIWDAQHPGLAPGQFDRVVANHMLYHVPSVGGVLARAAALLKSDGVFCATTNGETHLREIWKWVAEALPERQDALKAFDNFYSFSMENGAKQLEAHFAQVELKTREDGLEVNEAQAVVDFVASSGMMAQFESDELRVLSEHLESKLADEGVLRITKNSGMFVARRPV